MQATTGRSILVLLAILVLAAGCSSAPTPSVTNGSPAPSPSATPLATAGPGSPAPTVPAGALQLGNTQPLADLVLVPTSDMADNRVGVSAGPIWDPYGIVSFYPFGYRWAHVGSDWSRVEQTNGQYTISAAEDAVMSDYAAHGVTTIVWLGNGNVTGDHVLLADPAWIERYGEYVRFMVRHYKDRIRYFELWNEPNGVPPNPTITVADYVAMVRHVVPIIRAEDPGAKIVIPGSSGSFEFGYPGYGPYGRNVFDRDWFFGILDSDAMPLVDAISWHPFFGNRADDPYYQGYPDLVREIKARAEAHGFRGEYIATSMSWRTLGERVPQEPQMPERVARKYLLRTTVLHRGLDLTTIIAPSDGNQHATALTNMNVLLAGAQPLDLPVHVASGAQHLRQYSFALPDGSHLVALWTNWLPVEHDPGVAATVTIDGLGGRAGEAIDLMAGSTYMPGSTQQLITSTSNGALVIKDLLVKDYPTFIRIGGS
jgi:hypothetical protein